LATLVAEAPRAISRADLQDRIWPDTFVSDTNLAGLIAELRATLGDDAREPRYIRTVQRFGYAFCGEARPPEQTRTAVAWLTYDGYDLPLFNGRNVVGRVKAADVRIDDPSVSRAHAAIVIIDGEATVEDLGSKNGTSIEAQPLRDRASLFDGAAIVFGSVETRFHRQPSRSSTMTIGPRSR
jgi:hypothetical protein